MRCSVDGKRKSYCTPEAYRGDTCWLFRNRGDGTFEDATVKAGLFDTTSKSLGVAMLDYNGDGLHRSVRRQRHAAEQALPQRRQRASFEETALTAGVAFSHDGKARAGMGVDAADYNRSGAPSIAVTNFNNEMLGLFRNDGEGEFEDIAPRLGNRPHHARQPRLRLPVFRRRSRRLARSAGGQRPHRRRRRVVAQRCWLRAAAASVAQPDGQAAFATWPRRRAADFAAPKIGRGAAVARFRPRRRSRRADHRERRAGAALSQRSRRRPSQHPV